MPLNPAQRDIVHQLIGFNISLANHPSLLLTQVNGIKEALSHDVNENHPFYHVSRYFREPQLTMQRLETLGDSCHVSEVQSTIIDFIESCLHDIAPIVQCSLGDLAWDSTALKQQLISTEVNATILSTVKPPTDSGDSPWVMPPLDNVIYTRVLEVVQSTRFGQPHEVWLQVSINPPYSSTTMNTRFKLCNIPDRLIGNDVAIDRFIQQTMPLAETKARTWAAKQIPALLKADCAVTAPNAHLITHVFYYEKLRAGTMSLVECKNISTAVATYLIHPLLIGLIQDNILTFADLKKRHVSALRAMAHHYYNKLLKHGIITKESFFTLDDRRARFMILPAIVNQQKRGQLTFAQILALPISLEPLFNDPFYRHYFGQDALVWSHIPAEVTPKHVAILLTEAMKNMVKAGLILIPDEMDLVDDVTHLLAKRLLAVVNHKPFTIHQAPDTMHSLRQDVLHAAQLANQHTIIFLNDIYQELARALTAIVTRNMVNEAHRAAYQHLLSILQLSGREQHPNWVRCFSTLAQHTAESENSHDMTLFVPAKRRRVTQDSIELDDLRECIAEISQFANNLIAEHPRGNVVTRSRAAKRQAAEH